MTKVTQREIDFILNSGEGLKTEFKESPNHIDKTMTAFANAEGGRIYLGINDKKEIKGVNITNNLKSQIQDIARKCDPPIEIIQEAFKNILIIEVKESAHKPHKCKEGRYFYDDRINEACNLKAEFDLAALSRFLELAAIKTSLQPADILLNLGAAEKADHKIYFKTEICGLGFASKEFGGKTCPSIPLKRCVKVLLMP